MRRLPPRRFVTLALAAVAFIACQFFILKLHTSWVLSSQGEKESGGRLGDGILKTPRRMSRFVIMGRGGSALSASKNEPVDGNVVDEDNGGPTQATEVSEIVRIPPWIHLESEKFPVIRGDHTVCGDGAHIVVCVHSHGANAERRDHVRRTWGSVVRVGKKNIKTFFVLGTSLDENLESEVDKEQKYYNDIIQFDFVDSYYNLSLKTILSLNFVVRACPTTQFIVKTDDDMFVLYGNLVKAINSVHGTCTTNTGDRHLYLGRLWENGLPIRQLEPGLERYYLSPKEYAPETFPRYASGSGYVLSHRSAKAIIEASKQVPIMHIEDAYIGECAQYAKINVTNYEGFTYAPFTYDECIFNEVLVTSHGLMDWEMAIYWKILTSNQTGRRLCPNDRILLVKTDQIFEAFLR